jgi:hypothetical protein
MPLVAAEPDDAPALLARKDRDVVAEDDQIASAGRGNVLTEAEGVDSPPGIVGQRDARLARPRIDCVSAPRARLACEFSGADIVLRDLQQPTVFDRTRDRLRDRMATMTRTRGPVRYVAVRRRNSARTREQIVIIAPGVGWDAGARKRARDSDGFQHQGYIPVKPC